MKILLMGPAGSGKGTQGELLSKYLNLPVISVGHLLRNLNPEHPWYREITDTINDGHLAPQDKVAVLLKEALLEPPFAKGYIMDGWGRTPEDLVHFDPSYDKVILINISPETSISRLSTRRTCAKCGAVYNISSMPPKVENVCDRCGGELIQRDDDKEAAILKRLEIFNTETRDTVETFRSQGNLIEVPGEGSPEEVFEQIKARL